MEIKTFYYVYMYIFMFLFGGFLGWCLEVIFRKFFSKANPDHKWLNPGLLTGPCLPIYGFGTCFLFTLTAFDVLELSHLPEIVNGLLMFFGSAVVMTLMELIGGEFLLRVMKMRLWDYSHLKCNFDGVICLTFFFIWGIVSVIFFYFVSTPLYEVIKIYFADYDFVNFIVGAFFGVFFIDIWTALGVSRAINKYAKDHNIVIHFETVKEEAARQRQLKDGKSHYFMKPHKELINEFMDKNFPNGTPENA